MFSFGTEIYRLNDFDREMIQCPLCAEQSVFVHTQISYFQISDVPIYAKGKYIVPQCRSCNSQFRDANFPEIEQLIKTVDEEVKKPWWLYLGTIVYPAAILVALLYWLSIQ